MVEEIEQISNVSEANANIPASKNVKLLICLPTIEDTDNHYSQNIPYKKIIQKTFHKILTSILQKSKKNIY